MEFVVTHVIPTKFDCIFEMLDVLSRSLTRKQAHAGTDARGIRVTMSEQVMVITLYIFVIDRGTMHHLHLITNHEIP